MVTPGKLAIASEGTKSIRGATFPEDIIQLRSFLGAFNVYGKYANWFSRVVRPLNNMLTKDAEPDCLNPSKEELEAFEALKETLVTPPALARQKKERPYMVDTDPSKYAIGAVLVQQQDENYPKDWVLIGHWSKTFTQPEENYWIVERECLAVVWALKTLHPYLQWTKFTVRSDHDALRQILSISDPYSRLTRWWLTLSEFYFTVTYRLGRLHQVPDALSRMINSDNPSNQ